MEKHVKKSKSHNWKGLLFYVNRFGYVVNYVDINIFRPILWARLVRCILFYSKVLYGLFGISIIDGLVSLTLTVIQITYAHVKLMMELAVRQNGLSSDLSWRRGVAYYDGTIEREIENRSSSLSTGCLNFICFDQLLCTDFKLFDKNVCSKWVLLFSFCAIRGSNGARLVKGLVTRFIELLSQARTGPDLHLDPDPFL